MCVCVCVCVCVQQNLPAAAASIVTSSASSETAALIKMVQEQQKAIAALSMQLAGGTGGPAAAAGPGAGSVTDDGAACEARLRNTKRSRSASPPAIAEEESNHDSESERSDADLPAGGGSKPFNLPQERAGDKSEIVMPPNPERPAKQQKVAAAVPESPARVVAAAECHQLHRFTSAESNSESTAGSESDAEAGIDVDAPGEGNLLMKTTAPDAAEKQRVDAQAEQRKAAHAAALFEEGRGFHRPESRRGQHQNFAKAIECYTQAAALNHAEACLELAELYLYGLNSSWDTVESDRTIQPTSRRARSKKAVEWYLKACEKGVRCAQQRLGQAYLEGRTGIKVNLVKASHWLTKAAHQGCRFSWSLLSTVYLKGLDRCEVAEDQAMLLDKAITCCRQAAEMHDPWAHSNMVDIYIDARAHPDLRCKMLDDMPWLQDLIDKRCRWHLSR